MTRIIAVSNQKGGVAKTTSCFSLGACLAEAGHETLIVDLDPQANLTLAAGFEPEDLDGTIANMLMDGSDLGDGRSYLQPTSMDGLSLLAADQRLAELESVRPTTVGFEQRLADGLKRFHDRFEYILIDCPPSLGTITLMALTAADMAFIPLQCDYFATRGLMNLLAIVEAIQQRTNPALTYALFVTMYDARPLISRRILAQLRENFSTDMCETVIGLDTRLRESAMANEPVITYASKTRASEQYRSLAAELILRCASIQKNN